MSNDFYQLSQHLKYDHYFEKRQGRGAKRQAVTAVQVMVYWEALRTWWIPRELAKSSDKMLCPLKEVSTVCIEID